MVKKIFLLLLLSFSLYGQPHLLLPQIRKANIYTLTPTVNINYGDSDSLISIMFTHSMGFNPFIIEGIDLSDTNVIALLPNTELVADSNGIFSDTTTIGDWGTEGGASLTNNSDSTATFSNVAANKDSAKIVLATEGMQKNQFYNLSVDVKEGESIFYESDFSLGTDGFSNSNNSVVDGNIDKVTDGSTSYDNVLAISIYDQTNTTHRAQKDLSQTVNKWYYFEIEYLFPSSNSHANGFSLANSAWGISHNPANGSVIGTWTKFTAKVKAEDVYTTRIYLTDDAVSTFTDDANLDTLYIANFKLYELEDSSQTIKEGKLIWQYYSEDLVFEEDSTDQLTSTDSTYSFSILGKEADNHYSFDGDDYITFNPFNYDSTDAYSLRIVFSYDLENNTTNSYYLMGRNGYKDFIKFVERPSDSDYIQFENWTDETTTGYSEISGLHENKLEYVYVYNGNGTVKWYYNGDSIGVATNYDGKIQGVEEIGRGYGGGSDHRGNIYIFNRYNRALSNTEVSNLYLKIDISTDSLKIDFNGTSGNVSFSQWTDDTGNNHGTVNGATAEKYPRFSLSLTENAKATMDNFSVKENYYKVVVEHGDTISRGVIVKGDVLGSHSVNLIVNNTTQKGEDTLAVSVNVENLNSLVADAIDFDTVTTATVIFPWIKNLSASTLNITSYSGLNAPFYSNSARHVSSLAPGDSTQLEIYFNPISANGAFIDTFIITHNGNGSPMEWTIQGVANLPLENLLSAPTELTASNGDGSIDLSWSDPNIPDTLEYISYDFTNQSDTIDWKPRHGEPKERVIENGKMKTFDDNLGTAWPSTVLMVSVNSTDTYRFSVDAEVGTANSVWFVIINKNTREYYVNYQSTKDTVYTATLSNISGTDSLEIYLQCVTDNGEYSYFDNFLIEKTYPSYDGYEIYAQKFLNGSVDIPYYLLEYVLGGGLSYSHSVSDGDEYSYKVRYKNNTDYSPFSNEDTLLYSAPSIYADYYVKATGTNTTFSTATEIGSEMDMATFEAGWVANLSVNDLVHFSGDFEKEYVYGVTAVNSTAWDFINLPNGVKFFSTDKAKFTVYQELYGWDNTSHWVLDNTTYSDGTTFWTYDFSDFGYYDLEETGCSRLWFDDKETPMWLSPDISAEGSTVAATGAAKDSTFGRPNANYRFTINKYDMAAVREVHVWDSAGINPATKYNSIKHIGGFKQLINFENTDNLTVDGLVFEGSDFFTVTFKNCDNVTFSNSYITKFEYMAIRFNDCATVTMFGDSIYSGYADVSGTGHIYYEYFSANNGLDVQNSTSNIDIYDSWLMDITTMPFRVISSTGNTTNVRFHNNVIGTNITMDYARPYQIGESTAGASYYPSNIHIYNNLMKNGTMRTKNIAQYTYTYFNTFVDWTNFKDSISHHFNSTGGWDKPAPAGMGNSFQFGHTSGTALSAVANEHWFFNNTYLNFNATPISYESKYQRAIPLYWINNAFINMSRKHVKKGTGHPSFTNATGDIDFLISEQGNSPFILRNNYIWNDQTVDTYDSTIVYGQYNGSTFTPNYYSLSGFESALVANDTATNNIKETNVAKTLSNIINTTTYEMQTTSAQDNGYMDSRILTILGPNFFDRFGNRVTNADGTLYNSQINRGSNNK